MAAWLRGRMDGATILTHGMVQYCVVWCGMAWSGVVSYVIVWCGGRMDGATQTSHYGGGGLQHHCRVGTRQGGGALRMVIRHGRHGRGVHLTRSGGPSALCLSRTPMSHFVLCL